MSSEIEEVGSKEFLRNSYCPLCGRQFSGEVWKSPKCSDCDQELKVFELLPVVRSRRAETRQHTIEIMTEISSQYDTLSPFYCMRVYEVYSKILIKPRSGYSEFQRRQDLCDFLEGQSKSAFQTFADDLDQVLQSLTYTDIYEKIMSPDIWKTKDAGGRALKYDPFQFRIDLNQHFKDVLELRRFDQASDALMHLIDVYASLGFIPFDEIVYSVYSAAAQAQFYGQSKPSSIVTVQSRMGRRRPEWGWD